MRRPATPKRTTKARVFNRAWTPALAEAFSLADAEWQPPHHVRVTHLKRGFNLVAKFLRPDGNVATLSLKLREGADGSVDVVEEKASFRFVFKPVIQ